MRTTLNTEYRTLKVYFIIHVFVPLQFKVYSPKFTIKITLTNNHTISKNTHQRNTQSNPQLDISTVPRKSHDK